MNKQVCLYCNKIISCLKGYSCEDCTLPTGKKIDCRFAFVNKSEKIAGICNDCRTSNEEAIEDAYAAQFQ